MVKIFDQLGLQCVSKVDLNASKPEENLIENRLLRSPQISQMQQMPLIIIPWFLSFPCEARQQSDLNDT